MSSLFLLKVKQAAYNAARPRDGEPIALFMKAKQEGSPSCAAGDVALVYTPDKQPAIPACFVVGSINEGEPACYSVTIEKYDPSKKDSHLIRYSWGVQEWQDLLKEKFQVLYLNGEVISAGILSSPQIEGITVKIINTDYSIQLTSDTCATLEANELPFTQEELASVKVLKRIDAKEKLEKVRQIITDKTGITIAMDETPNAELMQTSTEVNGGPSSPLHDQNSQSTKREADELDDDVATRSNKKIRPSPVPSPADIVAPTDAASPADATSLSSAPASPPPPNIDLIKHIAGIAQMVKEMDDEHSDRLTKVESEVVRIRSILQQHSLFTHALHPGANLSMSSPSLLTHSPLVPKETPTPTRGNGSAKKVGKASSKGAHKSKSSFSLTDIHIGELIAVRADKSITPDSYYWMARVFGVTKSSVKVRWYEPCEFAHGWFFLDNKEDDVDVETIFLKNFELTLKPCRHPSGLFIDIYKPVTDLKKYDTK